MKAVKNKLCNLTYTGPTPDIFDLPCRQETVQGRSVVMSYWKPTESELEQLNKGGTVRLGIYYIEPIPPVSLDVIFTIDDFESERGEENAN
jgi:hypothetical protein